MSIGAVLGIVAGFSGGFLDPVIGRVIDLTLSFPSTLMLLALSGMAVAFLTGGSRDMPAGTVANAVYVILVLGLFGWPRIARIIRGQALSLREREFVDAARAARRVARPDLLQGDPAQPVGAAPGLLHAAAAGLRRPPRPPSASSASASSRRRRRSATSSPTRSTMPRPTSSSSSSPAFMIAVIVVGFNLFGDGLRDALDPKIRPLTPAATQ